MASRPAKILTRIGVPVLTIAAAGLLIALFVEPFASQADTATTPQRIITMSGHGEAKAAPDQAQLSAGVTTEAKTARAALSANTAAMNKVFATLKQAGIPGKAIQTSNFSVSPQYPSYNSSNPQPRQIIGYQVSNTVSVSVDDLSRLGPTLDALVSAGANNVGGVSFSISDPQPLLAKARAAAVKDAQARAETYAKAAGIKLGPIMSINEGGGNMPQPMFKTMAMRAEAAPVPVAAGEETIAADVSISWQIR